MILEQQNATDHDMLPQLQTMTSDAGRKSACAAVPGNRATVPPSRDMSVRSSWQRSVSTTAQQKHKNCKHLKTQAVSAKNIFNTDAPYKRHLGDDGVSHRCARMSYGPYGGNSTMEDGDVPEPVTLYPRPTQG